MNIKKLIFFFNFGVEYLFTCFIEGQTEKGYYHRSVTMPIKFGKVLPEILINSSIIPIFSAIFEA